jgi:uncharacterized membrane protein YeaQ/YmgE (transglycosylase-associated protein family)
MLISVLLFVAFGFAVGLLARALVGGPSGLLETSGVGMAGAVTGGLVAHALGWVEPTAEWSVRGFAVALFGAVALILLARIALRRQSYT